MNFIRALLIFIIVMCIGTILWVPISLLTMSSPFVFSEWNNLEWMIVGSYVGAVLCYALARSTTEYRYVTERQEFEDQQKYVLRTITLVKAMKEKGDTLDKLESEVVTSDKKTINELLLRYEEVYIKR